MNDDIGYPIGAVELSREVTSLIEFQSSIAALADGHSSPEELQVVGINGYIVAFSAGAICRCSYCMKLIEAKTQNRVG